MGPPIAVGMARAILVVEDALRGQRLKEQIA